jgi:hypothetical protein
VGWLIENTLEAVARDLPAATKARQKRYRRAEVVLRSYLEHAPAPQTAGPDVLDPSILETLQLQRETQMRLREVGGANSKLHARLRMYVDIVSNGLPLLPQVPRCHAHPLRLQHFEIEVLDVVT